MEQPKKKNWFLRHPIISVLLILFILGGIGSTFTEKVSTSRSVSNNSTNTAPTEEVKTEEVKTEEVKTEETMEVTTADFIAEFDKNQLAAEEKYKDKMIKFTASVQNISEDVMGTPFLSLQPTNDSMYFGTTVKCDFKDKSALTSLANNQTVTLQGRVDNQSLGIIGVKDCSVTQ